MEVDVKMCNFRPTCKHLQIEIAATASPRGSHASFSGSADVVATEPQLLEIGQLGHRLPCLLGEPRDVLEEY